MAHGIYRVVWLVTWVAVEGAMFKIFEKKEY
jgi:hypothetical protein